MNTTEFCPKLQSTSITLSSEAKETLKTITICISHLKNLVDPQSFQNSKGGGAKHSPFEAQQVGNDYGRLACN